MAPIVKSLAVDDDFVLTISDNDQDVPGFDEEGESDTERAPEAINGAKRKRDQQDTDGQASKGKAKKAKTAKLKDGTKLTRDQGEEDRGSEEQDYTWTAQGEDDGAMDSDFEFQIGDVDNGVTEDFDGWGLEGKGSVVMVNGNKKPVDIDELIARRKKGAESKENVNGKVHAEKELGGEKNEAVSEEDLEMDSEAEAVALSEDDDEALALDGFGMGAIGSDEEDDTGRIDSDGDSGYQLDDESIAEPVSHPNDQGSDIGAEDDDSNNVEEAARREAFFAPEEKANGSKATDNKSHDSFQTMSLSRPILRGLASVGFAEPTPIQKKTVPMALLGKDVVGGAVTGSGKTAAFIIPILERLLYRPKKVPTSRVAILMPTRELAVQCFNVAKKLASFTDVTFCQLVGGFSLREQESVLRSRPDVIIATPGRFIDHMRNSASFTVDTLEILVLDEADRMLEDGFADELNEILTTIPKSRQTMLFSATMTSSVDKLIRVGLNRPVRLMVDAKKQTVGTLVQEFVRLRPGREEKRLGYLMHLCENVYTDRVIIFFRQKKEAHRVRIIFGLCGLKAAELHGSMSQEQRISAIESFRSSHVSYLLATDVASRGLDIKNVSVVLNYEAPQSHSIYLHRVGRTARAGRFGRSCTIAAEPDRKVIKEIVKSAKAQGAKIVSRIVEKESADAWATKVDALKEEVEEIMRMEREEKQLTNADRDVKKGENLMKFENEIMGRPKRTWFESEREKRAAKKVGRVELNGGVEKKGKGKLSGKDKKRLDDRRERVEGKVWKKGREERGRGAVKSKVKTGKGKVGSKGGGGKRGGKR